LGQGEPISLSFFFKTANTGEMILVAYAGRHKPYLPLRKDILLITIKDGVPIFYTTNERYVIPDGVQRLNDNVWHHIAITMPKKNCLLSQVDMYIDGSKKRTSLYGDDERMFFNTAGTLSFGGWGYTPDHEGLFPEITHYEGMMDNFHLWARPIHRRDLRLAMKKNFQNNWNFSCIDDENTSKVMGGRVSGMKCRNRCNRTPTCWGYELEPDLDGGKSMCYLHHERPRVGKPLKRAKCNPTIS
jgi:hypothetical protein